MSKTRSDIQVIRGLAVLAVILFHVQPKLFPLGFLGVDAFFVISGFLITPLLLNAVEPYRTEKQFRKTFENLRVFFKRRFYRLAPTLSGTIILTLLIAITFGPRVEFNSSVKQSIFSLALLGNLGAYLISTDYFASSSNPLVHTWSLGVEEQFYLLAPVLLLTISIFATIRIRLVTILIFATSLLLFMEPQLLTLLLEKMGISPNSQSLGFYSVTSRAWEFASGSFLAILKDRPFDKKRIEPLRICTKYIFLFFLFSPTQMNHTISTIFVVFLSVMIIYCGSFEKTPIWFKKLFKYLGDWSYTLYLTHLPIIYLFFHCEPFASNLGLKIVLLPLILYTIGFFYNRIEKPFRRQYSSLGNATEVKFWLDLGKFIIGPLVIAALLLISASCNFWGIVKPTEPASWEFDKNCDQLTSSGPPCTYQKNNSKGLILLTGDSYAAMYSGVIRDIAREKNFDVTVWAHHSCNFISSKLLNESSACYRTTENSLNFIESVRPDYVVIANYPYSNSGLEEVRKVLRSPKLSNSSKIVIGAIPSIPHSPTEFKSLFLDFSAKREFYGLSQVNFGGTTQRSLQAFYKNLEREGIKVVDPTQQLCGTRGCKVKQQGKSLYSDPVHLTYIGSLLIKNELSKLFK